jgi:hypothetical protein
MVIRGSRWISAIFRESPLVKNQTVHSSSPGLPGTRPIGRAFAPPFSLTVTAQQYRTFPIVSRVAASSWCTLSEAVVVASLDVAVAIADLTVRGCSTIPPLGRRSYGLTRQRGGSRAPAAASANVSRDQPPGGRRMSTNIGWGRRIRDARPFACCWKEICVFAPRGEVTNPYTSTAMAQVSSMAPVTVTVLPMRARPFWSAPISSAFSCRFMLVTRAGLACASTTKSIGKRWPKL